jgi:hypothetical protein
MTDESSRANGNTLEPMALDEEEKQLLRAAFDPAPARIEAVRGLVVARIAALAAAGAGASAATASAASSGEAAAGAGASSAVTGAGAAAWSVAQWWVGGIVAAVIASGAFVALRGTTPTQDERAATQARVPAARTLESAPVSPTPASAAQTSATPVAAANARSKALALEVSPPTAELDAPGATPLARSQVVAAPVRREAATTTARVRSAKSKSAQHGIPQRTTDAVQAEAATVASAQKQGNAEPAVETLAQPTPQPVAESLARELSVLRKARGAIERGSALLAISLLDEYGALFPNGVLRQEELATRALALCAIGRAVEARQAARALARIAPRSPHLIRLADSCALREISTGKLDDDDATHDR